MRLQFSATPVPREEIEAAKAKRAQAAAEARAIAFAQDEEACQAVVNAGRKRLKTLRKIAEDFANEFKKLEGATSAPDFQKILDSLNIRYEIGTVRLTADYDDVAE